jgi:serine protease DegQ
VGIEVQEITPEIADSFNLKSTEGALIAGVLRGGPADRAGIHPGDILVAVGGKPVRDSSSLLNLIAVLPPGKVAQLRLIRAQVEMQLMVTVEKRPVMRKAAQE